VRAVIFRYVVTVMRNRRGHRSGRNTPVRVPNEHTLIA
jgi:hypothetical protein